MSKDVIIYGAGGHGRVVLDIIKSTNKNLKVKFFTDDVSLSGLYVDDCLVLTDIDQMDLSKCKFVCCIGSNSIRRLKFDILKEKGIEFLSPIHLTSVLSANVRYGDSTVFMAGSVVNTGVNIGDNTIINTRSSIDHDCKIGSHVHIGPGVVLCGNVTIGDGAFIGAGSVITEGIIIGEDVVVGAGTTVYRNIPQGAKVVGSGFRSIKEYDNVKK